jgi:cobalt/nickel transport system permease protein
MSCGRLELLNDTVSYEKSFITQIDPRIKLGFTIVYLLIVICSKNLSIPLAVFLGMVIGLLSLPRSSKIYFIRGIPALLIALTILMTQIFFYGKSQIFCLHLLGIQIPGYREGLDRGILLMFRVLAGISLMMFLTLTTSIEKLIFAAKWFHFPEAFLEVLTIAYRYIFIIFDEINMVRNAQKIRLGFSSFTRTIHSLGDLSGIIILRTIDKSEKLYKSMQSRGYHGQSINIHMNQRFSKSDWLATFCLTLVLSGMILFSF